MTDLNWFKGYNKISDYIFKALKKAEGKHFYEI